jgi:hypothetical protein
MNEKKLNEVDKNRIKTEIKLSMILGLLFTIALIVVVFIVPSVLFFLNKPSDGFIKRGLFILALLSFPMLLVSWKNVIKYIDLKRGNKIHFQTTDYEIKKEKEDFVLRVNTPSKMQFDLYDKLPDLIKFKEPITIEATRLSKTLLYISQGNGNLLEKVEIEND